MTCLTLIPSQRPHRLKPSRCGGDFRTQISRNTSVQSPTPLAGSCEMSLQVLLLPGSLPLCPQDRATWRPMCSQHVSLTLPAPEVLASSADILALFRKAPSNLRAIFTFQGHLDPKVTRGMKERKASRAALDYLDFEVTGVLGYPRVRPALSFLID